MGVREELHNNEVLVEMSSVGLCHTDISMAINQEEDLSNILGHEGSGVVKKIGPAVVSCAVGDPVLLSFNFCKVCENCTRGREAYCHASWSMNAIHEDPDNTYEASGKKVLGKFFGQSSFSRLAVVSDACIVNVKEFDLTLEQLDTLGPLGCSFQTGVGAIINASQAKKGESCVVYGLGGVGLAGIMAAKIVGCNPIIAVDISHEKLDLAKELGATQVVLAGKDEQVHLKILELTGTGADISLECVGGARFVESSVKNAGVLGRIVFVGLGNLEEVLSIPSFPFMLAGKQLIGCIEGNSTPKDFVPKMIRWHLNGIFPFDKIEKEYPIEDFNTALQDMKKGKTVKAVLKF